MPKKKGSIVLPLEPEEILKDYRLAYQSRQASLIGRREVLSGKAKFGIFGDGKELANLAIARAFRKGDWRSGYYRDQTWMFTLGVNNIQEFFAQLYAHADLEHDPSTAGRGDERVISVRAHSIPMARGATKPKCTTSRRTSRRRARRCRAPSASPTRPCCIANLEGRTGQATPTTDIILAQRRRSRLRHHRQRLHRRGHVLGKRQRHRRAQSPRAPHHLRRRLRHLRPQPIPDGQGKHRHPAQRLRARPQRAARQDRARLRPSTPSAPGTIPRWSKPT